MSYRSIKRVLGESSLERKCRFLFGVCLLALISASFYWHNSMTEGLIYRQNRIKGRQLADQVVLIEHFVLQQNEYAALYRRLITDFKKKEFTWRIIKPNTNEPDKVPKEEFEWTVLERFLKRSAKDGEETDFAERLVTDRRVPGARDTAPQEYYEYYLPVYAEKICVNCHNSVVDPAETRVGGIPIAEGDLMAVVQVSIGHADTRKAMSGNRAILLSMAIATAFLAMLGAYVIVRYVIVKPLRHLRDVSDAVSHGNISMRAEIHTGDEFESLALAFNRMLGHMVTAQDELRQANSNLDAKVDELAQANMQLYELNRVKSDFLATMSHELRTPLNSILGFSDVLRSINSLDDKQKRYVENIQKSGRALLDMINDILDLAKIESGKMEIRLSDFRIEQLIGALCDMSRPLAERKNIDLQTQTQSDLPPMRQDQGRVQQILNNLLSNAIKFTPEGGRIKVTARRDEYEHLLMQVIDTGVGIAQEDQQVIFEKFRQGRTGLPHGDAITREYSGTGLGLSIVKELCKVLGGEVFVESVLGKGSTFTVRLPWRLEEALRMESREDELAGFAHPRFETPAGNGSTVEAPSSR